MKKLLALLCTLLIGPAVAQQPSQTFSSYVNTLPQATLVNPADQFYLLQGGVSKSVTTSNMLSTLTGPLTVNRSAVSGTNVTFANTITNANTGDTADTGLTVFNTVAATSASNELVMRTLNVASSNQLNGGGVISNQRVLDLTANGFPSSTTSTLDYIFIEDGSFGTVTQSHGIYISQLPGANSWALYDLDVSTNGILTSKYLATGPTSANPFFTAQNTTNNRSATFGLLDGFNAGINGTTGGSNILFQTGGVNQFEILGSGANVNFISAGGQSSGNAPSFGSTGSDTNIGMTLSTKGTGNFVIQGNNFVNTLFQINGSTTAVNFANFVPGNTGSSPGVSAAGSDTNIGFGISTKGSGAVTFSANNFGNNTFQITGSSASVDFLQVNSTATGVTPSIQAQGTDSNIGINLQAKGANGIFFQNGAGNNLFGINGSGSTIVNQLVVNGAATTVGPQLAVSGSDTNISLNLIGKGTGTVNILPDGNSGALSLQGSTSGFLEIITSPTNAHFGLTNSGSTAPTLTAGCNGAGSVVSGSDVQGTITGQTTAATTCTLTFGVAYGSAPTCTVTGLSSPLTGAITVGTATIVVNFASTANYKWSYHCYGT